MTDNYKALIEELHALQPPFSYSKSLGGRSARAVEALMAETEERAAERDALQQQIDAVREWYGEYADKLTNPARGKLRALVEVEKTDE